MLGDRPHSGTVPCPQSPRCPSARGRPGSRTGARERGDVVRLVRFRHHVGAICTSCERPRPADRPVPCGRGAGRAGLRSRNVPISVTVRVDAPAVAGADVLDDDRVLRQRGDHEIREGEHEAQFDLPGVLHGGADVAGGVARSNRERVRADGEPLDGQPGCRRTCELAAPSSAHAKEAPTSLAVNANVALVAVVVAAGAAMMVTFGAVVSAGGAVVGGAGGRVVAGRS